MVKTYLPSMPLRAVEFKPSPIPEGLTIVSVPASPGLPFLRHALTFQARAGQSELGVPMPTVSKVLSLIPATPRAQELVHFVEQAFCPPKSKLAEHELYPIGSDADFDWTCDEGLSALLPIIETAPGWIIVEWRAPTRLTPAMAEGLLRIANAAQAHNTRVMLLAVGLHDAGMARLCQEYLLVRDCEPDPDGEWAFVVECWALLQLGTQGKGRTMLSIRRSSQGMKVRSTLFVSETLQVRFMAKLRAAEESLEVIGVAVGLHKSSVSRALQGLPPLPAAPMTKAERELWTDALRHLRAPKPRPDEVEPPLVE